MAAERAFAVTAFHSARQLFHDARGVIAGLIGLPLQFNDSRGLGSGDGGSYRFKIRPLILYSTCEERNPISRSILPVQSTPS